MRYNEKEDQLKYILSSWLKKRRDEGKRSVNPLEPFLYALKMHDGIVGSAVGARPLDFKMLDVTAKVLLPYWHDDSEEDKKLICHILVNWNWYQPVLVVIRMYALKQSVNDEEIDEILRKYMLFSPDYSAVTCGCLTRHYSNKNAEALLKLMARANYSSNDRRSYFTITKAMRNAFTQMYNTECTVENRNHILKLYEEKFRENYADNAGRVFLDQVLGIKPPGIDELARQLEGLNSSTSDDEKKEHRNYLKEHWDVVNESKTRFLLKFVNDKELLDFLIPQIQKLGGLAYSSSISYLAQSSLKEAKDFVRQEYAGMTEEDKRWIGCACGMHFIDGSPSIEKIARKFFLDTKVYKSHKQLRWLTASPEKAKELREAVILIIQEIEEKPETWKVFFNSCGLLFCDDYGQTNYPVEIDTFLIKASAYAAEGHAWQITNVLNVIDKVISKNNKRRYNDLLVQIYHEPSFPEEAHDRAKQMLIKVNGAGAVSLWI